MTKPNTALLAQHAQHNGNDSSGNAGGIGKSEQTADNLNCKQHPHAEAQHEGSHAVPVPAVPFIAVEQSAPAAGDSEAHLQLDVAATETSAAPKAKSSGLDRHFSEGARFSGLKPFVIISCSYLLYTITDGAIRMIVLLYAYNLGFTAWEVAIMFTAYELAGVFTNLAAGMMGARWGIKTTLLTGLCLQICGIAMLFAWQNSWSEPGQKWKAIVFVTFAQMLCGIAKDLTKLGGKTVTKLVTPDEKQSQLFRLVSLITGWKNSLKGAGYFLGAACISFNLQFALSVLLLLIVLAMPWAITGLSNDLGRAHSRNLGLAQIFKQKYNVNVLSISRYFLFGSRDMWFEVPLPFFLRNSLQGLGWSRPITGLFLALWIILYGQFQSWTPQLVLEPLQQSPANALVGLLWCAVLVACPVFMGGMVQASDVFSERQLGGMAAVMVVGLAAYCIIFAINSSVHSYLIVRYADGNKVAMNIGFYYCANALGRLTGTLVSGALYSYVDRDNVLPGLAACFWASAGFAFLSTIVDFFLRDSEGGLKLGNCLTLVKPTTSSSTSQPPDNNQASSKHIETATGLCTTETAQP